MSGGALDYIYSRLEPVWGSLRIDADDSRYAVATRLELAHLSKEVRFLAEALRSAEWMLSSDTCEETFLQEMKELRREYGR
jgi:hypothetical protein